MHRTYITGGIAVLGILVSTPALALYFTASTSAGTIVVPAWVIFIGLPILATLGLIYVIYGFRILAGRPILFHGIPWVVGLGLGYFLHVLSIAFIWNWGGWAPV